MIRKAFYLDGGVKESLGAGGIWDGLCGMDDIKFAEIGKENHTDNPNIGLEMVNQSMGTGE